MPAIYASIRSANFDHLDDELRRLEESGVDGLHVDVMDGRFCDEVSLPIEQVADLHSRTTLPLDVHLMIERPEEVVGDWIDLSVWRIAFHLEACPEPGETLARIEAAGILPGLVILPGTPVGRLEPWLDQIGFVNPLGVNPVEKTGFDASAFDRIRQLKAARPELIVQADGGVWAKTRDQFLAAGADELVGGYPIFSKKDYKEAVEELRSGS